MTTINAGLRTLAAAGHHLQFIRQWRLGARVPHYFDPFIDLYWKWEKTRNPMSWERGIFGLLAMKPGCRQLDLCCGEGFHTHRFYSGRAGSIVAMDYNRDAIALARRKFQAPNIDYRCGDIRSQMPQGPFDNITWDAGIEYFTPAEIADILVAVKARLAPGGILSGYCVPDPHANPAAQGDGRKFAAASPEALGELLHSVFGNVTVLRTAHADQFETRTNCYFYAGDGALPLAADWPDLKRWTA
ncbi:MAG TPA: class I SAM-dependent methyltransferase [Rhizomicrobium sp.]|nr:class I SAM-dependent methyltransferase [Rhizomicrobium sp.]